MKACIFDLDGTLLDTLGDLHAAVCHALRCHAMPELTLEEVRWMVGNGVRRLMQLAVPDGENNPLFEAVFADFRAYYAEHSLDTTQPYPGIDVMLADLHRHDVRMAVVSNKMDSATKPLVRQFFGDLIPIAIGECEHAGIRRKPAPDMVFRAMERLGVGPEESVYVGDSDVDLATARNAGLPCLSVLWGFRDRTFLSQHGATAFAESPSAVVDWMLR